MTTRELERDKSITTIRSGGLIADPERVSLYLFQTRLPAPARPGPVRAGEEQLMAARALRAAENFSVRQD
jgi:hypothetical protein